MNLKKLLNNKNLNQINYWFEPNESYWNFMCHPHKLKKYWMENEISPQHRKDVEKYLAIESNPATIIMYNKLGNAAKPKGDFI